MSERTAADYAIEHAGYLANAANQYLDAINAEYLAQMDHDEAESPETEKALDAAIDSVGEANRRLRSCIYEFERRRDRALANDPRRVAQPSNASGDAGSPSSYRARPSDPDLNPVSVKDLSASASPATKEQQ